MELLRIIFVLLSVKVFCTALSRPPVLLVICFGGFRHDYFDKGVTPTLNALKLNGSYTDYMRNVFPTLTIPNLHSIATGLYPESHGALSFSVYDNKKKLFFRYGSNLYKTRDVTPIWIKNQAPKKGRRSGVMMWPLSEYEYNGVKPTFSQPLDTSIPWKTRVDIVIEWLTHKKTPANLVMMYFEQPRMGSLNIDPDSKEIETHLKKLDHITVYLRNKLLRNKILNTTNVIQLSDHGMESVTLKSIINISHLLHQDDYFMVGSSPVLGIYPEIGKGTGIYNKLKDASLDSNFEVYRKSEIPDKWHYKGSVYAPPILLVADEGYAFNDMFAIVEKDIKNEKFQRAPNRFGLNGYDNNAESMLPFFFAWGPNVTNKHFVDPFDTVDLYSLFCKLLNLDREDKNGTFAHVRSIFKSR